MFYTLVNISDDIENPKHIICYKGLPLYYPNQFLSEKGLNSNETRDAYAKILVRFFNYIENEYNISDFRNVQNEFAIRDFMHSIIYKCIKTKIVRQNFSITKKLFLHLQLQPCKVNQ